MIEAKGFGLGEKSLGGEVWAKKFRESGAFEDNIYDGIEGKRDAKDFLGDKAVQWCDEECDDCGDIVERKFESDCAGGSDS